MLLLPTVPTLLMELLNGNIEGVVCSKIVATSYMNIYPGLAFSEVPVESNKNGVGVAVAKGDENATLLAAVNETVERVVADGSKRPARRMPSCSRRRTRRSKREIIIRTGGQEKAGPPVFPSLGLSNEGGRQGKG